LGTTKTGDSGMSLKIISLGMGVQSTALYYMSSMGDIERCDYAIFVDTGREKKKTLDYLENILLPWQHENNGIPVIVVRKKNLYTDLLNSVNSTGQRFSSIPAFTKNTDGTTGMLRRQCTNEYKIEQVDRAIHDLYGLPAGKGKKPQTLVFKGISLDEIERLSIPDTLWKIHVYPFVGYRVSKKTTDKYPSKKMTRLDIENWYISKGLPIPPKSACVFCPYQSDASYADMKENEPDDFEAAVKVDYAIRNSTKKGIKNQVFLHDTLKPLDQIEFKKGSPDLWHGECSGGCHT
jgi:hypothetical protein